MSFERGVVMATIRIPGALRSFTAGADEVTVTATTVRGALAELERLHPAITTKILNGDAVKPFVKIFVGADDIAGLTGLDTPVTDRDELAIVPAIAGG
jgi:molybdopterin converting factor small subunit